MAKNISVALGDHFQTFVESKIEEGRKAVSALSAKSCERASDFLEERERQGGSVHSAPEGLGRSRRNLGVH